MKPITEEWVEKAEGDWMVAGREMRVRKSPNYDAVGFHCQQCVEKYLKGQLQEESITAPKTHDLGKLLDLLLPTHPLWAGMRLSADGLSSYAVDFRYPGDSADKEEARSAVKLCRSVRETVRLSLGLPV